MAFLFIAILNSFIGIIQQLRSRATLAKLNLLAEAKVKVLRDGRVEKVPVHKLVREDIVELSSGDQIPADGPVLSGQIRVIGFALIPIGAALFYNEYVVHEMSSIETLARVDVLCVDKTGTITSPEMSVRDAVLLDEANYPRHRVEDILSACYAALDADNDTGRAMAARFRKPSRWQVERTVPFTSATKWSAVVFRGSGHHRIPAACPVCDLVL